MNSQTRQYLFGLIFLGVGIYQATIGNDLELFLYASAGLSFVANALTLEPKLVAYKNTLVFITWTLILITIILFLYLLQVKF